MKSVNIVGVLWFYGKYILGFVNNKKLQESSATSIEYLQSLPCSDCELYLQGPSVLYHQARTRKKAFCLH